MTAAQLCGEKISTAYASTRKRWSLISKPASSDFVGRSCAIRKDCEDVSGRCYLSTDRTKFSQEAVIRYRKPFRNVVYSLVGSDCDTEPCEVEEEPLGFADNTAEESTLEKANGINGTSESVFQSPSQLPPQNVKRELIMLSLPAIASQAIDPFAQLMETFYIGKIGPIELASAGVSMSIFNLISKLFNMPLLSVATSFVAEDIAKLSEGDGEIINGNPPHKEFKRKQLSSVSTALLLALGIGIIEAFALLMGTGSFLSLMGISPENPMRVPAHNFLSLRALGAPAVVLSLALQGVLRGFKDTKTPVYCLGVANFVAIFLFPLFIHKLQMGVTGAAVATVVSQYIGSFLMLWSLSKKVVLLPPKLGDLKFGVYLKSGGFLIGRTLAVLITMTIGTSMAARQGPLAMAAHQICLQVWLAVSLLTDALAASGQALVASSMSRGDYNTVKELTNFVLKIGLVTGGALAVILGASYGYLANLFTDNSAVLQIVKSGTLFVSASQPLNALAFIFDGLHYGAADFPYAACSMMLVGAISSAVLMYAPSVFGLSGVWFGLTLFMGLRTAAGFFRIRSRNGPWWFLHGDSQQAAGINELGNN